MTDGDGGWRKRRGGSVWLAARQSIHEMLCLPGPERHTLLLRPQHPPLFPLAAEEEGGRRWWRWRRKRSKSLTLSRVAVRRESLIYRVLRFSVASLFVKPAAKFP